MVEIAQTADHALRILEELGHGESLTPAELSERLALNRTVVHRLLTTLSARGFVLRQEGSYRTGAVLLRLASTLEPELRAAAAPVMDQLSTLVGESVILQVVDGLEATVITQVVATEHVLQVSHQIGARHSLAIGAGGRAMLAFMREPQIRKVLKTRQDRGTLVRQLDTVRHLGYSVSNDELHLGVHGIAVPILDTAGCAFASLAIAEPTNRTRGLERHVDVLCASRDQISDALHLPPNSEATA